MNKIQRQIQKETDEEILNFVRGMQSSAPVTSESVFKYLTNVEFRKVTEMDVDDRLSYLVSAGCLLRKRAWRGGTVRRYEITAKGMDILDGNIPPLNWKDED